MNKISFHILDTPKNTESRNCIKYNNNTVRNSTVSAVVYYANTNNELQ